jgi:O-antigen/teichoic acid export membrane protein
MPPTENSSARILDNISALAIAQIVAMAAGFFSTAWMARLLGPEGYGIIGFGVAFTSFFGLMVVLGTDYYGSREIAQNPDKAQELAAKIIGLRFVLATVTLTIYFTIIYFIDQSQPVKIVMIIQAIGTVFIVIAIDFIFEGRQRMRAVAVRLGGTSVLSLVCILLFVRGSEDVYIAAAIPVLATAIGTIWLARQFTDWAQDWPSTVVLFTGLTVGTVIYIGMAFIFRIISFSDLTKLISQRIRLKRGGV